MVVNLSVDAKNDALIFIGKWLGTAVYIGKSKRVRQALLCRMPTCLNPLFVFPNLPTPTIARRS